eukprot:gene8585-11600_t
MSSWRVMRSNRKFSSLISQRIQVISLDITGTLLIHSKPIAQTYAACGKQAQLKYSLNMNDLAIAFKKAYKQMCTDYPCFGARKYSNNISVNNSIFHSNINSRDWWKQTVKLTLELSDIQIVSNNNDFKESTNNKVLTFDEFELLFLRIYQHYGCPSSYTLLDDAKQFLQFITEMQANNNNDNTNIIRLGVVSNSPLRTIDTVLPFLNIHHQFDWFVCCEEVGYEKPSIEIYEEAYRRARLSIPNLERNEILHIGDSFAADFCGAKAAGFQALYLDRSDNKSVVQYQDWLNAPHYHNKSDFDLEKYTIKSFVDLIAILKNNK